MVESVVAAIGDRSGSGQRRPGQEKPGDSARRRSGDGFTLDGTAAPAQHGDHAVVDVTSILGVNDGAIPAPVQKAMSALVEEVEKLRAQLALTHGHESRLAEQADHHPVLPVLHRRSFQRELGKLMNRAERANLPGVVIWIHVSGIEILRDKSGLAAGDAALTHVLTQIRSTLLETDPIGYLDGGDFVIGLAPAEIADGQLKAREIAGKFGAAAFVWEGQSHVLVARVGLAPFKPGVTSDDLILDADAARRGLAPAAE